MKTASEEWQEMSDILQSIEQKQWDYNSIKMEFAARLSFLATSLYIQATYTADERLLLGHTHFLKSGAQK